MVPRMVQDSTPREAKVTAKEAVPGAEFRSIFMALVELPASIRLKAAAGRVICKVHVQR